MAKLTEGPTEEPFNVFLAWSGERSKKVALALQEWIPSVIQRATPWMSERIHAGQLWRQEVARHLSSIRIGVLCMTPENIGSPWLHFEAGVLARSLDDETRVIPYLLELAPREYKDPLAMFQAVKADREDTKKLVYSINSAMAVQLATPVLDKTFDALWNGLESKLRSIATTEQQQEPPRREDSDVLTEILERVRSLERTLGPKVPRLAISSKDATTLQEVIDQLEAAKWLRAHEDQVFAEEEGLEQQGD